MYIKLIEINHWEWHMLNHISIYVVENRDEGVALYYIVESETRKTQRSCSPFRRRGQPLLMTCRPSESRASLSGTPRQVRSRSRGRFPREKVGRYQMSPWHRTSSFASPPPR